MKRIQRFVLFFAACAAASYGASKPKKIAPQFQTSDRCIACHNGLTSGSGEDVSIGFLWRASMMANSSRDPYWQASTRREITEHPDSKAEIEDECSVCHMPIPRYGAHLQGRMGEVFSHLPFDRGKQAGREAQDGVSCSVCHQISSKTLGTTESFSGGFKIDEPLAKDNRREYGPYSIKDGQTRIMTSSTEGYHPTEGQHIRDSKLCATCHTLYTVARGDGGKPVGKLPEQMPYFEWLNSDFSKNGQSCQSCHMPTIEEGAPIAHVLGIQRPKPARHVFVGGNFFMQDMLNRYSDELAVSALSSELSTASRGTVHFLSSQTARLTLKELRVDKNTLQAMVRVENLTGHKLPTAYPSRRVWIHLVVKDGGGRVVFESGAIKPNGSITGNDNDADSKTFEPHYEEIDRADEVQIYESILSDARGEVTTGLLAAVDYLKDNRLLPSGFDKLGASRDIAVRGNAARDHDFTGSGDETRYRIDVQGSPGPFTVEVELLYQPIGFRWANNLKPFGSFAEPQRFTRYYDSMAAGSSAVLSHVQSTVSKPSS